MRDVITLDQKSQLVVLDRFEFDEPTVFLTMEYHQVDGEGELVWMQSRNNLCIPHSKWPEFQKVIAGFKITEKKVKKNG